MKSEQTNVIELKNSVRDVARKRLLRLGVSERADFSKKITSRLINSGFLKNLGSIFVYVSRTSEVDTVALIQVALAEGIQVFVPRIANGLMAARRLIHVNQLVPGYFGILEPPEDAELAQHIDLVVTPGLAFGTDGSRLGHGAGFYDRWLSKNSYNHASGLSYDLMILNDIPTVAHDKKLDTIVTEKRTINCHTQT